MGYFDENPDTTGSGGNYITKDEKEVLISNAVILTVKKVVFEKNGGYKGTPRFLLTVDLDGEDRSLTFQAESVESRDRMLYSMTSWFEAGDATPVNILIQREGRSLLVRDPNAVETGEDE